MGGISSEKDAELAYQTLSASLEKKFKVLIRASDRSKFEQYIVGSVSMLIQTIQSLNNQAIHKEEQLAEVQSQFQQESAQMKL